MYSLDFIIRRNFAWISVKRETSKACLNKIWCLPNCSVGDRERDCFVPEKKGEEKEE